ncbi:hypothetical protein TMatcc_002963 [Talaromyces marneffei ATCC 18224]
MLLSNIHPQARPNDFVLVSVAICETYLPYWAHSIKRFDRPANAITLRAHNIHCLVWAAVPLWATDEYQS